jgi:hypothetical protein
MILALGNIFAYISQVIFFYLRHGADGVTCPPKEVVLPIFIHRSRPGLNPRTLGRAARTITVTPPRTTKYELSKSIVGRAALDLSHPTEHRLEGTLRRRKIDPSTCSLI